MSRSEFRTRAPARRGPYTAAGILIVIGIVAPLLVPFYARKEPELFGMPFFYWYQMLWVFIEAFLLWMTYLIVTREDRRRRGPSHPTASNSTQTPNDAIEDEK
jgi:hypothetical protein